MVRIPMLKILQVTVKRPLELVFINYLIQRPTHYYKTSVQQYFEIRTYVLSVLTHPKGHN